MGTVYALDYTAVMAVASARGADLAFMSLVLPGIETVLISSLQKKNPDK